MSKKKAEKVPEMPDHTELLLVNGHSELVALLKRGGGTLKVHRGKYGRGNE